MSNNLELSLIVAMGENGVIGRGEKLPAWRLKNDMGRFVALTKRYRTVIVGRKTHEAILKRLGHPLAERVTIVLTRRLGYESPGCAVVSTWEEALREATWHGKQAVVIGGAEVYRLALPHAKTMYLTRVHGEFEGDVHFPPYNEAEWEVVSSEEHPADEQNTHAHTFLTLKRKEFVNLANARLAEQRSVMEAIAAEGVCPFCPDYLDRVHQKPILRQRDHWLLTENQWPYQNTRIHLLAIHQPHIEKLEEIIPQAWQELLELVQWAEHEYNVRGGGFGIRFGDPEVNGGTVRHLHAQFIVADVTDRTHSSYKPVRFRLG